eukprot:1175962-Prorocentrum_minimum.AAC.1
MPRGGARFAPGTGGARPGAGPPTGNVNAGGELLSDNTILSTNNTVCTMLQNINSLHPTDISRVEPDKADVARCKKQCTHAFAHPECLSRVFVDSLHAVGELAAIVDHPTQRS